jgi:hypothetical protein
MSLEMIKKKFRVSEKFLVFKVKEAEVCPNCSESYISGKDTKNIERKFEKLALTQ